MSMFSRDRLCILQDCEAVLKNTTSFCGKLNFVKSDGEELFRKMPSDILGSAKEELQSE